MITVLDIISGLCWSIVYITAIFLGVKHHTWFIPKIAICQNFAWEFWIVLYRMRMGTANDVSFVVQLVWVLLDIGVALTWLVFDQPSAQQRLKNAALFLLIATAMYLLIVEMRQWEYVSFIINVIMSILFVRRVYTDSSRKTSITIAFTKMIGTLAATIIHGLILFDPFTLWLGGICLLLDSYYLSLLFKKARGN